MSVLSDQPCELHKRLLKSSPTKQKVILKKNILMFGHKWNFNKIIKKKAKGKTVLHSTYELPNGILRQK